MKIIYPVLLIHFPASDCHASGDYIFKLYRATGDRKYAYHIRNIQHTHKEVVETPGPPTVNIGSRSAWEKNVKSNYCGCSKERIQRAELEKHSLLSV